MKEVVVDIPHGGENMPKEALAYLNQNISRLDLRLEEDLCSYEFYLEQGGIPGSNKLFFEFWRTIIDVNRELDDFSSDGIIKRKAWRTGKQLYRGDGTLPESIRDLLIRKYAIPYYNRLTAAVSRPEIKLVVLGHTMDPIVPDTQLHPGQKRPLFNLANGGDQYANPNQPFQASREIMEFVRDEVEKKLSTLDLNSVVYSGEAVSFNRPYHGCESISRIGKNNLEGKQAIMFEINKSLVIDADNIMIRPARFHNIATVRKIIHDLLEGVLGLVTK